MSHNEDLKTSAGRIDIESGIDLIAVQIEAAKKLLAGGPIDSKAHNAWNKKTKACLISIYGEGSPNIDTITEASGSAPTWLMMPNDTAERYVTSSLENKVRRLETCEVALKRKPKEAANS